MLCFADSEPPTMGGLEPPNPSQDGTPPLKATERAGGMTGRMPGVTRARRRSGERPAWMPVA